MRLLALLLLMVVALSAPAAPTPTAVSEMPRASDIVLFKDGTLSQTPYIKLSCPTRDPRCDCPRVENDLWRAADVVCGYASADWRNVSTTPQAGNPTTPPVVRQQSTSSSILPPNTVRVASPLAAALRDLSPSHALSAHLFTPIRNRDDRTARVRAVVGLSGFLTRPVTLLNETYAASFAPNSQALWSIYWDFSLLGNPSGPHVTLFLQLGNQTTTRHYFPLATDALAAAPQPGDYYYEHVLEPLRKTAGYFWPQQKYGVFSMQRVFGIKMRVFSLRSPVEVGRLIAREWAALLPAEVRKEESRLAEEEMQDKPMQREFEGIVNR